MNMDPEVCDAQTTPEGLLLGHPNTYCFSKDLAERAVNNARGHVKLCIVRPSIIISCSREPLPGWTDTISAGGAVTFNLMSGLGRVYRKNDIVSDFINGDVVSNAMLVCSAYTAGLPGPTMTLYQACSTVVNPCKIRTFFSEQLRHLEYNKTDSQIRPLHYWPVGNKKVFDALSYLDNEVPVKIAEFLSGLPYIGSAEAREQVVSLKKGRKIVDGSLRDLDHFKIYEWNMDAAELIKVNNLMSPKEQEEWFIDIRRIDWLEEARKFSFGVMKYYRNEDV